MLVASHVTDVERVVLQQPAAEFGHLLPSAPTLGECELHLDFPEGKVTALGVLLHANIDLRLLRVSIEKLVGSAEPALAAAIRAEDDGAFSIGFN